MSPVSRSESGVQQPFVHFDETQSAVFAQEFQSFVKRNPRHPSSQRPPASILELSYGGIYLKERLLQHVLYVPRR